MEILNHFVWVGKNPMPLQADLIADREGVIYAPFGGTLVEIRWSWFIISESAKSSIFDFQIATVTNKSSQISIGPFRISCGRTDETMTDCAERIVCEHLENLIIMAIDKA